MTGKYCASIPPEQQGFKNTSVPSSVMIATKPFKFHPWRSTHEYKKKYAQFQMKQYHLNFRNHFQLTYNGSHILGGYFYACYSRARRHSADTHIWHHTRFFQ
jgi:hypothetical protein